MVSNVANKTAETTKNLANSVVETGSAVVSSGSNKLEEVKENAYVSDIT